MLWLNVPRDEAFLTVLAYLELDDRDRILRWNNSDIIVVLRGTLLRMPKIQEELGGPFTDALETVVALYLRYGIEYTLQLLDGTFSLFLLDQRPQLEEKTLYVAVDRLGGMHAVRCVRGADPDDCRFVLTHERTSDAPMPAGTYSTFTLSYRALAVWQRAVIERPYAHWPAQFPPCCLHGWVASREIQRTFQAAMDVRWDLVTDLDRVAVWDDGTFEAALVGALMDERLQTTRGRGSRVRRVGTVDALRDAQWVFFPHSLRVEAIAHTSALDLDVAARETARLPFVFDPSVQVAQEQGVTCLFPLLDTQWNALMFQHGVNAVDSCALRRAFDEEHYRTLWGEMLMPL